VGILASILAGRDTIALLSPLAGEIERLVLRSYRQARKVVILLLGSTVLLVGLAMVLLPGPAILVIPLGLAILGVEFAWARRWLKSIRQSIGNLRKKPGPLSGGDG
jgi:tellurite resistance protein TerC